MATKYSGMVDLVKNLSYLQLCIEAQIEVNLRSFSQIFVSYDNVANGNIVFSHGVFRTTAIGRVNLEGSSLEKCWMSSSRGPQ